IAFAAHAAAPPRWRRSASGRDLGDRFVTNWQAGLLGFVIAALGAALVYWLRRTRLERVAREAELVRERIVAEAKREAETVQREARVQARDEGLRSRAEFEATSREQRQQIEQTEKRLASQLLEVERQAAK